MKGTMIDLCGGMLLWLLFLYVLFHITPIVAFLDRILAGGC